MQTSTFLFESLDVLRGHLSFVTERERQVVEVSWNTARLGLPLNLIVTFTFDEEGVELGADLELSAERRGTLMIERLSQARELHHNVSFSECPSLIAARFDVHLDELAPRMAWRRRELTWRVILAHKDSAGAKGAQREARLLVSADTSYFEPSTGLRLATELEVRARPLEGLNQGALTQVLMSQASLPAISSYWMSEYHYKRLMRLPTHQDLTGYEYEAKLSVKHLNIDDVPEVIKGRYEVIERYQTESIRWYIRNVSLSGVGKIKKGRVGFRGARASLVSKGKKQKLKGGILKRSEEKSQGLNTWDLKLMSKDASEMRRIKRQLYLRSQQSDRIYALCLDYCYVEGAVRPPLLQVELEYNGLLLVSPSTWSLSFSVQLELAERFALSAPKVALRCMERAEWLMSDEAQPEERARLEALQERLGSLDLEGEPLEGEAGGEELEELVLREMREILKALREAHGYKETSKTKREWLKEAIKTIDREPLL